MVVRCLVTFLITSVLNLCAVSYDRLTAIVLPRESRITMRGAKIIMTLTWLLGLTLAFPLAIYRNYKVIRRFFSFTHFIYIYIFFCVFFPHLVLFLGIVLFERALPHLIFVSGGRWNQNVIFFCVSLVHLHLYVRHECRKGNGKIF